MSVMLTGRRFKIYSPKSAMDDLTEARIIRASVRSILCLLMSTERFRNVTSSMLEHISVTMPNGSLGSSSLWDSSCFPLYL